jgi:hypothetical protein
MRPLHAVDNPAGTVGRAIVANNYLVLEIDQLQQNAGDRLRNEFFMVVGRN